MAKIIPPQDIPSELLEKFSAIGGVARPNDVAQRRYPWRIRQPGTASQISVWNSFIYCADCFGDQTQEQREWWYDQSIGSGLFYYTYFMRESLILVHQGELPPWCPALWAEYFPGTELDTEMWFPHGTTHHPISWSVNDIFIYDDTKITAPEWYHTAFWSYGYNTPYKPYQIEFKLGLSITGPNTYSEEGHVWVDAGDYLRFEIRKTTGGYYFVFRTLSAPLIDWRWPTDPEILHDVMIRFPETELMEIYFDGELKATYQVGKERYYENRRIVFGGYWWNARAGNRFWGNVDDIIVRRLPE